MPMGVHFDADDDVEGGGPVASCDHPLPPTTGVQPPAGFGGGKSSPPALPPSLRAINLLRVRSRLARVAWRLFIWEFAR